MSLYSETKIKIQNIEQTGTIGLSNSQTNPILSVLCEDVILLFDEYGNKINLELKHQSPPCFTEWHPSKRELAIGWKNGLVSIWNEESSQIQDKQHVHKAAVNGIYFNTTGIRMVTCDENGEVIVWRGNNIMSKYQREGIINNCTFCNLNFDKNSTQKTNQNMFFIGGSNGTVCLADDQNHCTEVCKVGGSIRSLLFYEKQSSVIIITSTLLLVQFRIQPNEKSTPDKKVKLSISGDPEQLQSIWVGSCLLATCSIENLLRMWHLDSDDNYVLTLVDLQNIGAAENLQGDKITTIKYLEKSKTLIAGTKQGRVVFWKNQANDSPNDSEEWKMMPFMQINPKIITQLCTGKQSGLIAVKQEDNISLIHQTSVKGYLCKQFSALQISSQKIKIQSLNNDEFKNQNLPLQYILETQSEIKFIEGHGKNLVIQTKLNIEVHEVYFNEKEITVKLINSFQEISLKVGIFGENIYIMKYNALNVTNLKGVVKQNITFTESEGKLQDFNILNNFMALFTSNNYIRIYDISRKEIKQIGITRKFEDSKGELGFIKKISVSNDGTKIGIISEIELGNNHFGSTSKFYIYNLELDTFLSYQLDDQKIPTDFVWDHLDKRYFGIVSFKNNKSVIKDQQQQIDHANHEIDYDKIEEFTGLELLTFFCTSENGISFQDSYQLEKSFERILGLSSPKFYTILRSSQDPNQLYHVDVSTLKDFVGIDKVDDITKTAIMNFSFYLSSGNLDEAYKSVKSIQNPLIWENMAQMCVKTKRLDVAEICIGNMRFARGARAIRESKKENQLEAQLAMVAIQLNMKDEAKNLYESCKRHDLLNKMYQASGEWQMAVQQAENHDRINLKNTYYKTAKLLEISRDFQKAIEFYEKSNTYIKEVPRMLINACEYKMLNEYVDQKAEKELFQTWAQYQESQGNLDDAFEYYKKAQDDASIVKIHLYRNEINKAKLLCNESNDFDSCYLLAKHYEMNQQMELAIQLYAKAQHYSHAVRLAMDIGQDSEVMSLSLMAPSRCMNTSAAYFEQKNHIEKAVILYMKAKNVKKALNLAVKAKLYDYIKKITADVDTATDTETLLQVAEYFLQNNQVDKAIHLLLATKQIDRALQLCMDNNIQITDEILSNVVNDKVFITLAVE